MLLLILVGLSLTDSFTSFPGLSCFALFNVFLLLIFINFLLETCLTVNFNFLML